MTPRILLVDDDPNLLAAFQRNLRKRFEFDTALGGEEALALLDLRSEPYAVVLADMSMPGMNGVQLLERVKRRSPTTVRMMLTGNADQQTAADAVNRGAVFRFLSKPCPPETLIPALDAGIDMYQRQRIEHELLEGTLTGCVKMLTDVLGAVAPEALGRGQRLRDSMKQFAQLIGADRRWELELGALLCQVGCAAIPSILLRKHALGAALSSVEETILRRIPRTGYDLLVAIPRLGGTAEIVLYQDQNYDGEGFPGDGRSGSALPLGARLLKILADRAALESDGVVKQRAYEEMKRRSGRYDPQLLDQCFQCFPQFLAQPISSTVPVQMRQVAELQPGQVVVSDITTPHDLVLVAAGNRLTAMMLERLRNYAELGDVKEPVLVQEVPAEPLPVPDRGAEPSPGGS